MNRITVSIATFGIDYDHSFVASSIPASLQEQLDEIEVALDAAVTADDYPTTVKLGPRQLVATQAELDFKRFTELVNEPSTKPVLVVKLPCAGVCYEGCLGYTHFILDGHHRVASARLRGVDVEAVVVG
jgi:hypothetical protein